MKDQPARGDWRFNPERIWEVDKAGDEGFGRIGELLVSKDGHVCFRDFGRNVSYLFDGNGRFIRSFAPQGAQAGQLPRYLNRFQAADKIVLAAPDKLHYFSRDGVFERAVENDLFARFPLCYINEHEFVYAPNLPRSPVHEKRLVLSDLASGTESTLVDFSETKTEEGGATEGPMLMIPSLTPQVRVDCDRGRMAFGRTDHYRIFVADWDGKVLSSFSLERKGMTATLEDKRLLLADVKLPEDRKAQIVARLPDRMTYFSHLDLAEGFIYVFAITGPGPKANSQQIDVFSEQGEYLYRGRLEFGGTVRFNGASNLVFRGRDAYVILEDAQGRQTLAKYRVNLPQ
jgi:hypothetical protein